MANRLITRFSLAWILFSPMVSHGLAGSIVLTGHDPDYHGYAGIDNGAGAQHINQAAIGYILDSTSNPFAASGVHEISLRGGRNRASGRSCGR